MQQLATISLVVLVLVPAVLGNHYALHCKKWKGSCDRYNSHCADDKEEHHLPKSCCELLGTATDNHAQLSSGRYTLKSGPFSRSDAWCDMHTQGGGWLTIMRREPTSDGTTDVFKDKLFQEYEDGFGALEGSFWYGLHAMEQLTSREAYEMRLDMYEEANHNVSVANAYYSSFEVHGCNYTLKLGNFTGSDENLLDNLIQFNNQPFIARKTAVDISLHCVNIIQAGAGWWYPEGCLSRDQTPGTILTREYHDLDWYDVSLNTSPPARKFAKYEMKIRPRSC